MDAIKIAKVNRVLCTRGRLQGYGNLHLTAHHLIFTFEDEDTTVDQDRELWVPYPLMASVTRMPLTLHGFAPLTFRTRTFEMFTLTFARDAEAGDVFDSVKELTVITRIEQLYAFDYQPNPPLDSSTGWNTFNPRDEFARMGVGSRSKAWRFTDINKDYSFCPTYPAQMVVPSRISDTTLTYAGKYRSKARIPALVYLHWASHASITRSSQPMVGLTNNRSVQDEKLIEAIFQSHHLAESVYASPGQDAAKNRTSAVYGATSTNMIIDARPTANAMVMSVKGAGTENMEHYKDGKKTYLGIDNIHVMRESITKVGDALRDAQMAASLPGSETLVDGTFLLDRQALRKSGWLKHISAILDGTLIIVRNIHINSSHVLIHCSDGWDRTAQLSALSQLCLDPYYRTYRGFQVLVEKDWLSFGHRFADRCGHLSSEKFFQTSVGDSQAAGAGGGNAEAAHAFLASMQNKFTPQSHLKETSPVFHQFLECVRQLQRQHPSRFEFDESYLRQIYYHLYACQFGTFLWNNERERRTPITSAGGPCGQTRSIWDSLNSSTEQSKYLNSRYDPSLDDRTSRSSSADMGVLLPDPKDVRFWNELYGKTDEEMNGRLVTVQAVGVEVVGPMDGTDIDPVHAGAPALANSLLPPSPSPSPKPIKDNRGTKSSQPPDQQRSTLRSQSLSVRAPEFGELSGSPSPPIPNDLAQQRPASAQAESFRPFESSDSTFTLGPTDIPRSTSLAGSSSQSKASTGWRWPDANAVAGGVGGFKSAWAQLSSNASAALSVVQGAYEGTGGKDDREPEELLAPRSGSSTGGELQPKRPMSTKPKRWMDNLNDDPSPWASHSVPSLPAENPWASRTDTPMSSSFSNVQGRSSTPRAPFPEVQQPVLGPVNGPVSRSQPFEARFAATSPLSGEAPYSLEQTSNSLASLTLADPAIPNARSTLSPSVVHPPRSPSRSQPPTKPSNSGPPLDPLGVGYL
ncbi:hypothetical protein FRB96_006601 [Tulasnella sp. 330]|nr:hypothetical protein FRB96_006601 [Tulasnella sp. 330]KAG8884646.1 hypothetical protein FRB97_003702 [Tulasnella sp. 331]KAG8889733.1 hypothetical protein FRB98_003025 [Tulasnella sp. 332]